MGREQGNRAGHQGWTRAPTTDQLGRVHLETVLGAQNIPWSEENETGGEVRIAFRKAPRKKKLMHNES